MSISISSSTVSETSKKEKRFETKEARREAREVRRQEREARREARKAGKGQEVSIPENPIPSSPTTQAGSTTTIPGQSTTPIPTPTKAKTSSISDLNGANVVNFAVQGNADGGSHFSVFASGKGPGAIDPEKAKAATTTSSNTDTQSSNAENTVNTVA